MSRSVAIVVLADKTLLHPCGSAGLKAPVLADEHNIHVVTTLDPIKLETKSFGASHRFGEADVFRPSKNLL